MFFAMLKRLFDKLTMLIRGFQSRWEKRHSNDYGYSLGGPKRVSWLLKIFIAGCLLLFIGGVFVKKGFVTPVETTFDRETTPGVKLPSDLSAVMAQDSIVRADRSSRPSEQKVDCDRLVANLRLRGTLIGDEKVLFDRSCREKLGKAMSEIIDKILSGEVPPSVAAQVIQNVTAKNAEAVLAALNNDEVKKALRTDAAEALAKNLGNFGKMSDQEIAQAVRAVEATPPKFRETMMETIKSTAQLDSPEARDALLKTIANARSAEELQGIRDFATTVIKGTPDEQRVFAEAFEKAPDLATRRTLQKTASEILQIPADDPVRGKLVAQVKAVSELAPEKQREAYQALADTANIYRTTNDPEMKKAIGDAIMATQTPGEVVALAKRLGDIRDVEKAGIPIDRDSKLQLISGQSEEKLRQLAAAAAAARTGDLDGAKAGIAGELTERQIREIATRSDSQKDNPFSSRSSLGQGNQNSQGGKNSDVTAADVKAKQQEAQAVKNRRSSAEARVSALLTQGVAPGDSRIIELYKEIADADARSRELEEEIANMRAALRKKFLDLKERTSADFGALGVVSPEIKADLPDDVVSAAVPMERLSNLRDVDSFWTSSDGSTHKRTDKYAKFNFASAQGTGGRVGGGSSDIMAMALAGQGDNWDVAQAGPGVQTQGAAGRDFEMFHSLHIPGVLHRIPTTGIPSKQAAEYTLIFEFLQSVPDRRTGVITIPAGSYALCKVKSFTTDTGRLSATCSTVETEAKEDLRTNFTLGDVAGADGVPGKITDERGWYLAGIFLTAFSASLIDGVSQTVLAPVQAHANKSATDFVTIGGTSGASSILQNVAQKQVDEWSSANYFWNGFDGMTASIRQN